MRPLVYVETSIPSFYFEPRTEPEMIARRDWTQHWWQNERSNYQVVTSVAVLDELNPVEHPVKEEALKLLDSVSLISVVPAIAEIVSAYIQHRVMPADPSGDALHLALASFHKCDFLLTWNCRHLANANKFGHIRRVNALLGLFSPQLVTPLELIGGQENVAG